MIDILKTCKGCKYKYWDDYPQCKHPKAILEMQNKYSNNPEYHPPILAMSACPDKIWVRTVNGAPISGTQTQITQDVS